MEGIFTLIDEPFWHKDVWVLKKFLFSHDVKEVAQDGGPLWNGETFKLDVGQGIVRNAECNLLTNE